MAKKKTEVPATTGTQLIDKVKHIVTTHKGRVSAEFLQLLIAKEECQILIDLFSDKQKDIEECLQKFSLADIEAAIGANAYVTIDGEVKYSFSEGIVVNKDIDAKGIMSTVAKIIPDKYFVKVAPKLDQSRMVEEALDGTLDPNLIPYVTATKVLKTKITRSTIKTSTVATGTGS